MRFSGGGGGRSWDGYLAVPPPAGPGPGPRHADAAILFLPDVIGIWRNAQLMADEFAASGYATLIADLFDGDPVPANGRPAGFDFAAWRERGSAGDKPHTEAAVDPIVRAAVRYLREERGFKRLGAVGYCFGAKVSLFPFSSSSSSSPSPFVPSPSFFSFHDVIGVGDKYR